MSIKFDYSKASTVLSQEEIHSMKELSQNAKSTLLDGTGAGNEIGRASCRERV